MQDFMARYQHTLIASAGVLALVGAFYTGYLEGNKDSNVQPVTLSCKDNILDKLSIPVQALARGVVAHASGEPTGAQSTPKPSVSKAEGKYVGSKNSTKYYSPSCGSVKRIKPANYIWFDSAEDAQLQGYTSGKC